MDIRTSLFCCSFGGISYSLVCNIVYEAAVVIVFWVFPYLVSVLITEMHVLVIVVMKQCCRCR